VTASSLATAVGFASVVLDGAVAAAGASPNAAEIVAVEAEQVRDQEPAAA
jgi:hypothetical protein